jgi:hypothetical protein
LDDQTLLSQLEELAKQLGIGILYENISTEESYSAGGFCRLKKDYIVIIQPQAPVKEKIRILTEMLKTFPLGDRYLKPAVREWLEGSEE